MALGLWGLFLIAIFIFVGMNHAHRSVLWHYTDASLQWFNGGNLYRTNGKGFIYFPQSAILMYPLTILPGLFRELFWRALSIVAFAGSLKLFIDLIPGRQRGLLWLISTIVALPIMFSSSRNGQMNIVLAALMMLSIVACANKSWWACGIALVLGLLLKPTMIVLLLLLMALYRPLWWRVPLLLIAAVLLPYLFQSTAYVNHQYVQCIQMLQAVSNLGNKTDEWAQIFDVFGRAGYHIPEIIQNVIRVIFALFTLGMAYIAKQRLTKEHALLAIFALAASYLMLFNPRSENNDYVILAPALGVYLGMLIQNHQAKSLIVLLIGLVIGIAESYPLGKLITGTGNWLAPIMAAIFYIFFVYTILADRYTTLFYDRATRSRVF